MASRDREANLTAAKGFAEAAGVKVEEEAGRKYIRKAALGFENDAKQRGALESAEVNRHVTAEFIAVTGRTYIDEITREDVFRFHKVLKARAYISQV